MKKKNTDILIKKAKKRYTKRQLFLKKLIPSTVLVLVVFSIFAFIVLKSLITEMSVLRNDTLSIITDNIYTAYNKNKDKDNFKLDNLIHFYLCLTAGQVVSEGKMDDFAVVYDSQTGKIVNTSEKDIFMIYSGVIYRCDDKAIDTVLNSVKKYNSNNDLDFVVRSAYIKEDRFIPLSVDISKKNDNGYEIIDTITFDELNTDGYKYCDFDNRVLLNVIGTVFDEESEKIIEHEVQKIGSEPVIINNNFSVWNNTIYCREHLIINNKKYEILYYSKINLLNGNEKFLLLIEAGIVITISAVISWLLASKKYSELSAHYVLEDYRRELTNTLAHDLKSPLTVISGCAENIKCGSNPQKNGHYSDSILENVNYMDSIINNVLNLSKLESENVTIQKTSVNLKELTDDILKKYETVISEKCLIIKTNGNGNIKADRNMISHAFENLITNAIKYSELSEQILIEISDDEYTITNKCKGFSQINTDDLCKPFVKGDESRSGKKGSGLGLTIVKNIIDVHGYNLSLNYLNEQFTAKIIF